MHAAGSDNPCLAVEEMWRTSMIFAPAFQQEFFLYNSRRLLVDGPSKISGHHTEIDFVKSNFDEDKLLYIDIERAEQWNKEWALKTKSFGGELVTKVQFLGQRITDIETYVPSILTKERLVNFISGG